MRRLLLGLALAGLCSPLATLQAQDASWPNRPITLMGGFVVIAISLNYLAEPLQAVFSEAIEAMLRFAVPATPVNG